MVRGRKKFFYHYNQIDFSSNIVGSLKNCAVILRIYIFEKFNIFKFDYDFFSSFWSKAFA